MSNRQQLEIGPYTGEGQRSIIHHSLSGCTVAQLNFQHTTGPWQHGIENEGYFIANGELRPDIAKHINSKADADLIAAAPDLLEALLNALPYVEDVLADKAQLACFKPGVVQGHAKAIRAAVAKATGATA